MRGEEKPRGEEGKGREKAEASKEKRKRRMEQNKGKKYSARSPKMVLSFVAVAGNSTLVCPSTI